MKKKAFIDRTRDSVQAILEDPKSNAKVKLQAAKLMVEITKVRKHKKHKTHAVRPAQTQDLGNLMSKLEQ